VMRRWMDLEVVTDSESWDRCAMNSVTLPLSDSLLATSAVHLVYTTTLTLLCISPSVCPISPFNSMFFQVALSWLSCSFCRNSLPQCIFLPQAGRDLVHLLPSRCILIPAPSFHTRLSLYSHHENVQTHLRTNLLFARLQGHGTLVHPAEAVSTGRFAR